MDLGWKYLRKFHHIPYNYGTQFQICKVFIAFRQAASLKTGRSDHSRLSSAVHPVINQIVNH